MPYLSTRRLHGAIGKKVSRYFMYRKAKRMYNDINREMTFFESRFLKSRLNHV
ncbi:MAG: hypothetical protein HZA30_04170 [Candidatus Omnitrophica bacterium]|nr:hypothetical protein [Candidatus Omnitrophota bacterium]